MYPRRKYFPFIDSGLRLTSALANASKFEKSWSSSNSRRPILTIMSECSFTLNSICPYFDNLTASISSSALTKVPLFKFGISPLGPRTLARGLSAYIYSYVAISLSNSIFPSPIALISSLVPKTSAPASRTLSYISASANTHTLTYFPVPAGNTHVPLMFWSPCLGSTLSLIMASTLSLNLRSFDISLTWWIASLHLSSWLKLNTTAAAPSCCESPTLLVDFF